MISFKWRFPRETSVDYFLSNCSDPDLFLVNIFNSRLKTLKELVNHVKTCNSTCNAVFIQKSSEAIASNNNTDHSYGQFLLWKHSYFSCQALQKSLKTSVTQNQCISHDGESERRAMQTACKVCNRFIWYPGLVLLSVNSGVGDKEPCFALQQCYDPWLFSVSCSRAFFRNNSALKCQV